MKQNVIHHNFLNNIYYIMEDGNILQEFVETVNQFSLDIKKFAMNKSLKENMFPRLSSTHTIHSEMGKNSDW